MHCLSWRFFRGCTAVVVVALLGAPGSAVAVERAIDKDMLLPASLDAAWSAWTTREGITSFFAPDAVIDARVGGAFHIYINPLAAAGERGADDMRFLAVEPKKMISFDWNAPPSLPHVRRQRTFVVVRFFAVENNVTRVSLHHTGWGDGEEWDKAYVYFERAWGNVLGNLKKRFEIGPIDWTPWLTQLKQQQQAVPQPPQPQPQQHSQQQSEAPKK